MAISNKLGKTKPCDMPISYEDDLRQLIILLEALRKTENDLDALDCLAQIIGVSNRMSRVRIVKQARTDMSQVIKLTEQETDIP